MIEFAPDLRHYCRNPRCRMRLPAPVSNPREAFCTRGCYRGFYRHRCRVCEGPIEQKGGQQRFVCKKAKCKSVWRSQAGCGRFANYASSAAGIPSKKPVNKGVVRPPADEKPKRIGSGAVFAGPDGRQWRVVAGPESSLGSLWGATVPDGTLVAGVPTSRGSAYERMEAHARKARTEAAPAKAAPAKPAALPAGQCLLQPHHPPVNVLGGYRFPDAPVIDLSPSRPD